MCVGAVSFQMVDYMTSWWGEYLSQPCPGTIDAQLVSCPGLAGVKVPGTCPLVCPPSPEVCPDGLLLATSGLSSGSRGALRSTATPAGFSRCS